MAPDRFASWIAPEKGTVMMTRRPAPDLTRLAAVDSAQTEVLNPTVERALLQELADCKRKLAQALADIEGIEVPRAGDDPQSMAQYIAHLYPCNGAANASLGAVHRRYCELRGKLALANMKLVAHVAKRFRDRGIPYQDLMQEGFCGLLESIDRFDLAHPTKLATYATWWIRQAMQRAVASGAYPVRLTPRHLRQLAQDQEQRQLVDSDSAAAESDAPHPAGIDIIHFIHTATRPAVSLDTARSGGEKITLIQTISDPDGDRTSQVDSNEAVHRLIEVLRPREQEVLALRFGLDGRERLSLSQVGILLEVSKERVRQIEARALEKLKARAEEQNLGKKLAMTD
jgi:RNA polymerase primary sigma factor